jgi:hypothetical protein
MPFRWTIGPDRLGPGWICGDCFSSYTKRLGEKVRPLGLKLLKRWKEWK